MVDKETIVNYFVSGLKNGERLPWLNFFFFFCYFYVVTGGLT